MAVSLANQPSQSGISMARSPIMYRYTGCSTDYDYQFDLYCSTGTTGELEKYVSINRDPDLDACIIIDASVMISNFIRNNFSYTTENVAYFHTHLLQMSGSTTGTTASNVGIATLGYNKYTDGVNYTDQTTAVDYIMNFYNQVNNYPIFNYTGNTSISWRDAGVNTGYKILFTTDSGLAGSTSASFPGQGTAKAEIAKIEFSYTDLDYTTSTTTLAP